jgi:hypothetical protein
VFAVDLGGGVCSNALCGVCHVDRVSVWSGVVGCDDLSIGVASYEADALPECRQAVQDLGGHRTSDHIPADHNEIRPDALEICQDRLQGRQVAVNVVDGRDAGTLLHHTSVMISLFTKALGRRCGEEVYG